MKIQTITRQLLQRQHHLAVVCIATMMSVVASGDISAQTANIQYGNANTNNLLGYVNQAPTAKTTSAGQMLSNGGQDFRVMSASAANVRTAADSSRKSSVQTAGGRTASNMRGMIGSAVHGQSDVQQVACTSGCNSCGSSSCGGSCGTYRAGSMGKYVSGGGWGCGSCTPYKFLKIEGLFMERRGDSRFTLADDFRMNGFDFEFGMRITAGAVPDCVHGCEFTFTGPMEWDMSGSRTDSTAGINTLLATRPPLAPGNLSAFYNATGQRQNYTADYWSMEANKTLIGWDVAKLLIGARYIDYDEAYGYTSRNNTGQTGLIHSTTDNQLFGAQVGMDLLYPVARFLYTDFRARAGAYVNMADADVNIINNGSTIVRNHDDKAELAGVFELGGGLRYNLGESLSVRGGTEMWYLSGLATVPDQFTNVVTPNLGRRIRIDESVFVYGVSFGAEIRF
ncbi:hypothetical protein [Planctomycetes bacterium K23_9]|uniref:Outer membrane protein beta-barrel domain-containing protein n=1 Tax=Stieleria marina TaxID=1930275 RepID=A0A517P153_9BACT|nr:hypothetical protein K239x_51110 [Planctomycetes bacterium K23_9]